MDTIEFKWLDLPEEDNVMFEAIKETRDTMIEFFVEDRIETSNNPSLINSFVSFNQLMVSAIAMFISIKDHCNQINYAIEKLNANPSNQAVYPEIASLLSDVIHDLNLTVFNFYVVFAKPVFSFIPTFEKSDEELIEELNQASEELVPYIEKLFEQADYFDKYFEELTFLIDRYLNVKTSL
jgi:hypothetical protein